MLWYNANNTYYLIYISDLDKIAEVLLRHPRSKDLIEEGSYVSLKCHAEGNPEPEVEWYHNHIR